jgi:hypothetical protein
MPEAARRERLGIGRGVVAGQREGGHPLATLQRGRDQAAERMRARRLVLDRDQFDALAGERHQPARRAPGMAAGRARREAQRLPARGGGVEVADRDQRVFDCERHGVAPRFGP